MTEQWRPIPGYLGYEASSEGRVRSVRIPGRKFRGRVLSQYVDHRGYLRTTVHQGVNSYASLDVHTLVTLAFLGPRPNGMQVRHLDGDPLNNWATNLSYGTQAENNLDQVRHGTHAEAAKTHCPQGHPYDAENTWIRSRERRGRTAYERRCRACHRDRTRARRSRASTEPQVA